MIGDTLGCTFSEVININGKKQICLPNKEYICGHRGERINMAAKCKIFVTVT